MSDISKLPKWAQDQIKILKDTIKQQEEIIEILEEKKGETQIYWRDRELGQRFYMTERATICIGAEENQIRVSFRERKVRVSSDKSLIIETRAANIIELCPGQH